MEKQNEQTSENPEPHTSRYVVGLLHCILGATVLMRLAQAFLQRLDKQQLNKNFTAETLNGILERLQNLQPRVYKAVQASGLRHYDIERHASVCWKMTKEMMQRMRFLR